MGLRPAAVVRLVGALAHELTPGVVGGKPKVEDRGARRVPGGGCSAARTGGTSRPGRPPHGTRARGSGSNRPSGSGRWACGELLDPPLSGLLASLAFPDLESADPTPTRWPDWCRSLRHARTRETVGMSLASVRPDRTYQVVAGVHKVWKRMWKAGERTDDAWSPLERRPTHTLTEPVTGAVTGAVTTPRSWPQCGAGCSRTFRPASVRG